MWWFLLSNKQYVSTPKASWWQKPFIIYFGLSLLSRLSQMPLTGCRESIEVKHMLGMHHLLLTTSTLSTNVPTVLQSLLVISLLETGFNYLPRTFGSGLYVWVFTLPLWQGIIFSSLSIFCQMPWPGLPTGAHARLLKAWYWSHHRHSPDPDGRVGREEYKPSYNS